MIFLKRIGPPFVSRCFRGIWRGKLSKHRQVICTRSIGRFRREFWGLSRFTNVWGSIYQFRRECFFKIFKEILYCLRFPSFNLNWRCIFIRLTGNFWQNLSFWSVRRQFLRECMLCRYSLIVLRIQCTFSMLFSWTARHNSLI